MANSKSNVKTRWTADLRKAYKAGYNAGFHAHREIPNRFGTRHAAMNGFSKAIKNLRQNDKYTKK